MNLSYIDEMRITRHFLESFKLRLTDKSQDILPLEGLMYETVDPATRSLLGGVGPRPDPNFDGHQPPSAMGMVLMVTPSDTGRISCQLSGQFDVVHRYIPDLSLMRKYLIPETHGLKVSQQIAPCYKRYSVTFNDVVLNFSPSEAGRWVAWQTGAA